MFPTYKTQYSVFSLELKTLFSFSSLKQRRADLLTADLSSGSRIPSCFCMQTTCTVVTILWAGSLVYPLAQRWKQPYQFSLLCVDGVAELQQRLELVVLGEGDNFHDRAKLTEDLSEDRRRERWIHSHASTRSKVIAVFAYRESQRRFSFRQFLKTKIK